MPELLLRAVIPGTPRPQGSLRVITPKRGRAFARSPETILDYRAKLAGMLGAEWSGREPRDEPCAVAVVFGFPRPLVHWRPVNSRRAIRELRPGLAAYPISPNIGDLDKLQRLVGDALQLGGVLVDDRLIVDWSAFKRWTDEPLGWTELALSSADPP